MENYVAISKEKEACGKETLYPQTSSSLPWKYFQQCFKRVSPNGHISYHHLCLDPKVTHLSFADDVMIFFDGSVSLLEGIKGVFEEFTYLLGLSMNMSKTTLFRSRLSPTVESRVKHLGFQIGSLPVRYLGLPLLSRRMRRADFSPLIDSIYKHLSAWTVGCLSFAGRLDLIQSVLYSVVNFWIRAFLLPKGCLQDITKLCSKFLWSGNMSKDAIHKVSWKTVCLPKEEGGLGLRDLFSWNVVFNMKLIWWLFTKESSLWVAWIKKHCLRKHNFWTTPITSLSSWVWRSLLSKRPLAKQLLSCQIRNGQQASFWFDSWHPWGVLIDRLGGGGTDQGSWEYILIPLSRMLVLELNGDYHQ